MRYTAGTSYPSGDGFVFDHQEQEIVSYHFTYEAAKRVADELNQLEKA
jgi:hypothetical protein